MSLDGQSRRAVVAGAALTLGGGGLFVARSREGSTGSASAETLSPSFHESEETTGFGVDLAGTPILGSPDAPIDLYYWTDFQCPFCETFERKHLADVVVDHAEPGRIRIAFIPIEIFGADSMTAAVAARCVWEQVLETDASVYWDWHTTIFGEQGEQNSGWAGEENLISYTRSVAGVDADALATDLENRRDEFESAVTADVTFATSIGVTGTPSFVIYNRETDAWGGITGAQPPERFDEAIDRIEDA